jgi:hypothetical protein
MCNRNVVETPKVTEEVHVREMCCIVCTEQTENGARKFVKTCYCPPNDLVSQTFYHHSNLCEYAWRKCYGGWKFKMICYCGGPFRSYHR